MYTRTKAHAAPPLTTLNQPTSKLHSNPFPQNSVCFGLIGALPSALPIADESSLTSSASYESKESSHTASKSKNAETFDLSGSVAGGNLFIMRLIGGLPSAPESCTCLVGREDVSQMTGVFLSGSADTQGVPADDGPCPGNC